MMQVRIELQGGYVLTLVDYDSKIRIEGKSGAMEIDAGELRAAVEILRQIAAGETKDG